MLALRSFVEIFKNRDEKNKVKCIYIDPPFNTGSAFEHYDDNLEQSQWLTMMKDRLLLLKKLLRKDGLIFINIDEKEMAYLRVMADEIFGMKNFVNCITIKDSHPSGLKTAHKDKTIVKIKSYLLIYKQGKAEISLTPQYTEREGWDTHFNSFLEKEEGGIRVVRLIEKLVKDGVVSHGTSTRDLSLKNKKFKEWCEKNRENIVQSTKELPENIRQKTLKNKGKIVSGRTPTGKSILALNGRRLTPLTDSFNLVGIDGAYSEKYSYLLCDIWDDIDFNNTQNEGGVPFPASKKPEFLVARILSMVTKRGDLVLDSFVGSGTTSAVAHKMGRRWIAIEIGKHAETHCIKRLKGVLDGTDQTGISRLVNWKGGGGFRYYVVGESLISDRDMNWNLTYEEIARALFMMFDYSFIGKLEDEIYVGRRKEKYALSIASKDLAIIKGEELDDVVKNVKEKYVDMAELEIYTNKGVGVKEEDLPENVTINKIPESVLRKYKL